MIDFARLLRDYAAGAGGLVVVIVSIVGQMATVLTMNKEGEVVSGSNYGVHYFEDKCPIAYCAGLEELTFKVGRI